MGTEHPDTERMHRLFDEALADVDLTEDVVPGVLAGYGHRVKARRYQAAGVALAVLATAGVAVGTLPRGGGRGSGSGSGREAVPPVTSSQNTDYCTHQHWFVTPTQHLTGASPNVPVANQLVANPAADQKNCDALQTALRSAFPGAQLLPEYSPDLTLDSRLDQAQVKKVEDEIHDHDPTQGMADRVKYFGSELKYLADHPEDPVNVYLPDNYVLITAAGREQIGIQSLTDGGTGPDRPDMPELFMSTVASTDCGTVPAALKKTVRCTTVGVAGGWHGALWQGPDASGTTSMLKGVLTRGKGKTVAFSAAGNDISDWYRDGASDGTMDGPVDQTTKWINRWTGQTHVGVSAPVAHAMTGSQMAAFLDSSAFQEYADSHAVYIDNLPKS